MDNLKQADAEQETLKLIQSWGVSPLNWTELAAGWYVDLYIDNGNKTAVLYTSATSEKQDAPGNVPYRAVMRFISYAAPETGTPTRETESAVTPCDTCRGIGVREDGSTCPVCYGTGFQPVDYLEFYADKGD